MWVCVSKVWVQAEIIPVSQTRYWPSLVSRHCSYTLACVIYVPVRIKKRPQLDGASDPKGPVYVRFPNQTVWRLHAQRC